MGNQKWMWMASLVMALSFLTGCGEERPAPAAPVVEQAPRRPEFRSLASYYDYVAKMQREIEKDSGYVIDLSNKEALDENDLMTTMENLQDALVNKNLKSRGVKAIVFGQKRKSVDIEGTVIIGLKDSAEEIAQFFACQPTKSEFESWYNRTMAKRRKEAEAKAKAASERAAAEAQRNAPEPPHRSEYGRP